MAGLKENEFQVYGRCLDMKEKPYVINDGPITIPEQQSKLAMKVVPAPKPAQNQAPVVNTDTFGKPIEANLAIQLIKHAWDHKNDLLNKVHGIADDTLSDDDKEALDSALHLLYGITFDKTIILKILSQPNCEGLRSYLCKRDDHLSLVMVGVDSNGYDLNYSPADPLEFAGSAVKGTLTTKSLIGEYGYPPGSKTSTPNDPDKIDEHYVLLKSASAADQLL